MWSSSDTTSNDDDDEEVELQPLDNNGNNNSNNSGTNRSRTRSMGRRGAPATSARWRTRIWRAPLLWMIRWLRRLRACCTLPLFRWPLRSSSQLHKPRTITLPGRPSEQAGYSPNVIRNQKYTVFSFVFVVLYEQFKFFFNLYFLLVALSQLVPALRIGYLFTYLAPLAFVLIVTLTKEAYDDWKRNQRDWEANSQRFTRLTRDGTVEIAAADIKVGDYIVLHKDQRVPADMILVRTSERNGACFIRTDQLDGETDWKLRLAVTSTQKLPTDASLFQYHASLYVDKPQKDILNFVGTLTRASESLNDDYSSPVEALNVDNTLWSNAVLATGIAVGVVIYTGKDTRAVMNTSQPDTKMGRLDLEVNRLSKILFVLTIILSLLLVALQHFQPGWPIYFFRFVILFSSIIPISLRVNLDLGKTVYSMQIMGDREIRDTIVRTSTIPEDLGRIEYVLTDKTGTLTQNDMEFKKLHLGTISYGRDSMHDVVTSLALSLSRLEKADHRPSAIATAVSAPGGRGAMRRDVTQRLQDMIFALALCHNVTPIEADVNDPASNAQMTYQAASPDEVAIVKWTASVGLPLVKRDLGSITLQAHSGAQFEFDILQIFPFTSESKRMGIIVKDKRTGGITLYMKGADTVMASIVQYNDWLDEETGNMAREGLRTLVVARKFMSEIDYYEFERRYSAAKLDVNDRSGSMKSVVAALLEKDMELLGLTGVEDKLQENVKSTLELLRNAGIRVWMLTGDKIETAINIAVSSKLVGRNQAIQEMSKVTSPLEALDRLDMLRTRDDCCLVIDGGSLQVCLEHCLDDFVACATQLPAVVCCRCSPTQKADIVRLLKSRTGRKVCAIGDGGNDVSMIQAADVGIGIVGREGKQASLAADFSVIQFSHLARLLLWHGRNSYKRSSKLSQFVIHRGLIISIIQAVFSAVFYFAPIALYQGMLLVGYTTIYTMAPVFSLVLDRDITPEMALMYPELYKELLKGRSLSNKTFFIWVLISVYQGGVIMLLSLWLFNERFTNIVSISFTALIFNELLMIAAEINTWHEYMVLSEVITLVVYLASMLLLRTYFDLSFIVTFEFIFKVLFITLVSCAPMYLIKYLRHRFAPPSHSKLVAAA